MADHKPDPKRVKRLFARAWKCYLPILTKRLGAKTKDDLIFILLEEIYRLNPHFTLVLDENNLKKQIHIPPSKEPIRTDRETIKSLPLWYQALAEVLKEKRRLILTDELFSLDLPENKPTCRECGGKCSPAEQRICLSELDGAF